MDVECFLVHYHGLQVDERRAKGGQASGLMSLCVRVVSDTKATVTESVLDQRGLWVAPCVADVDNERNPAVVHDGLRKRRVEMSGPASASVSAK